MKPAIRARSRRVLDRLVVLWCRTSRSHFIEPWIGSTHRPLDLAVAAGPAMRHMVAISEHSGCESCTWCVECESLLGRAVAAPPPPPTLDPDPRHVPEDEPHPVLRPSRPWGCIIAVLVWLAFWAVVIALVIHIVTP